MFFAKWLVLLGEKRLPFQTFTTHRAHKAGVVPGGAQSFQEHVTSLYGKFASTTYCSKKGVIICLTVRFSIFQVENIITDGFSTGHTHKTGHVPGLFQSIDDFSKDLPLAPATLRSKELLIAQLAVQSSLLLNKPNVGHRIFAVSTVKFFWMPRFPQSHKERSPDDLVAVGTHGSSLACWNVLSSLHECVLVTWLGRPHSWVHRCPCTQSRIVWNSSSRRCCLVWSLPAWRLDGAGGSYRLESGSSSDACHSWPAGAWALQGLRCSQRGSSRGGRWLLRSLLSAICLLCIVIFRFFQMLSPSDLGKDPEGARLSRSSPWAPVFSVLHQPFLAGITVSGYVIKLGVALHNVFSWWAILLLNVTLGSSSLSLC